MPMVNILASVLAVLICNFLWGLCIIKSLLWLADYQSRKTKDEKR